jgi:catechol 2,3-dioxygenase-like lactoylglutathione lyase family enzyme
MSAIRGLHHNAYRCPSSEQTRRFYEDFLGLPLAGTTPVGYGVGDCRRAGSIKHSRAD